MSARIPNFFLAGAPKTGSTSLYNYLGQHPQVYTSPLKEPHYFADEIRAARFGADTLPLRRPEMNPVSTWAAYLKLFEGAAGERAIGEGSVCYLWSSTAARNIASRIPGARIVIVLRNPADRAFSQYRQMLSMAKKPIPLRSYAELNLSTTDTRFSAHWPFLEFGLYYSQILRYFDRFPREQIHIGLYEDYQRDPAPFVQSIFRFVNVDEDFTPDIGKRFMEPAIPRYPRLRRLSPTAAWKLASRLAPDRIRRRTHDALRVPGAALTLAQADRAWLAEFYRDDIQNLSRLLGRNLEAWLRSDAPYVSAIASQTAA